MGRGLWSADSQRIIVGPAHDTTAKQLLVYGGAPYSTLPAGQSAQTDLDNVIDNLFNHPNVGPFLAKQLIQRLVTSNPSPQYIARVASKFNNNGSGIRGDMQAVIRAILLDGEARTLAIAATPSFGKLTEPVVRFVQMHRAFNARRASGYYGLQGGFDAPIGLNQSPLHAPSVFNFYHPDYIPAGPLAQAGLLGPEFEITNASSLAGFAEYSKFFIINGFGQTSSNKALWIQPDYTYYLGLAGTPTQMLDALDLVLCAGSMNPTVKAQIVASITKMTLGGNIPAQKLRAIEGGALAHHQFARLSGAEVGGDPMRHFDVKRMRRREFLRLLGGVTAAPLMGPMSELAYGAGPFNDYRALVCVFMFGGNDAHNMIVPLDSRFTTYTANRGPLALPQASLQANAVTDSVQGPFGIHPRMVETRSLFNTGKLAIVSNVGVLLRPTSIFDYQNKSQLPPQLFSHNDMQQHWHTCHPQTAPIDGWGGRLADLIQSANTGQVSVSISTASSSVFLKGHSAVAHQILPGGGGAIVEPIRAFDILGFPNANLQTTYQNTIAMPRTNALEDQFGYEAENALQINDFMLNALYTGPDAMGSYTEKFAINTVFPAGNSLAQQLRSVALMIAGRQALGVQRQIFFVSVGGSFDNHSDQFDAGSSALKPGPGDPVILFGRHADLLSQLDTALKAFHDATVELGVQNRVTTFTASDFGRTLTSNGKGSDHGWGGHQLVMGDAVTGRQDLWHLPQHADRQRQSGRRRTRAAHPRLFRRSVRGHAIEMDGRQQQRPQHRLPESAEFREHHRSRLPRLTDIRPI